MKSAKWQANREILITYRAAFLFGVLTAETNLLHRVFDDTEQTRIAMDGRETPKTGSLI